MVDYIVRMLCSDVKEIWLDDNSFFFYTQYMSTNSMSMYLC